MSLYREFEHDDTPYHEREGVPHPFWAAVGQVTLEFAYLDDVVTNLVAILMRTDDEVASIVLAGVPLRTKMDILGSLAQWHLSANLDAADPEAQMAIDDLIKSCRKSMELRNTYIHSSYIGSKRRKVSARAKRGLRETEVEVSAEKVLDVAYYIGNTAERLTVVPVVLGLADRSEHTGDGVRYTLRGEEVARFSVTSMDKVARYHEPRRGPLAFPDPPDDPR